MELWIINKTAEWTQREGECCLELGYMSTVSGSTEESPQETGCVLPWQPLPSLLPSEQVEGVRGRG